MVLLALSFKITHAQMIFYNNYNLNNKNQIILLSNNELGTNTLPVNILKKYFNNDSLSSTDKQFIKADTLLSPSIGFESQYGFCYLYRPDSILHKANPFQFILSADQNSVFSLVATRDLALNLLNGNSSYVQSEQKIKLSPSGFQQLKYQRIGFGVHRNFIKDSSNIQVYVKANFINVQKYNEAQLSSSYLKFEDTTYDASGEVHLRYNKALNSNAYFGSAGKGFSIDAGVTYKTYNSCITASITNVGRIFMKGVKNLMVDTSFFFTGYQVDMNRLMNDSSYQITADSLFNVAKHTQYKRLNTASPYTIRLNSQNRFFKGKILSVVDVSFKNLKSFTPRIAIAEYYQINNSFNAGLYFASGGFTKWQYGLAANYEDKHYLLRIQLQNPHSIFTKKSLAIAGVFASIGYSFN